MAKLISAQEAANRLGVTRQTILNWAKSGVISVKRDGHKGLPHLVDWETLEPLCGTVQEMLAAKEWFELRTKDYKDATNELETLIKDTYDEIIARKRIVPFVDARDFYLSIPKMMQELGVLNEREAKVVTMLIEGKTMEEIGEDLYISRERVRQIFFKAIRKSSHIAHLKEELDAYEQLKKKYATLQEAVNVMDDDFKEYVRMKVEAKTMDDDPVELSKEDEFLNFLSTPLSEFDFSVRCLNCLRYADIRTIADLVRLQKRDVLCLRNFGKKSLTELDDFIEEKGLQWGMNVDELYRKAAVRAAHRDASGSIVGM